MADAPQGVDWPRLPDANAILARYRRDIAVVFVRRPKVLALPGWEDTPEDFRRGKDE